MKKLMTMIVLMSATLFAVEVDNNLLDAISKVESNNNERAYNRHENAVGILQIRLIYVKDVNRIYNKNYKHGDCWKKEKSYEIAKLYLNYYGKMYKNKTGKEPTYEVYARIHNGGQYGYNKEATKQYWNKVKRELNK